jgi:hypothetical protein
MGPVAPERRHGGDDQGGVDIGGFSFHLQNVDEATRMGAPTPTQDASAPAALQHIPAAALLEAALESEGKLVTLNFLKETYEELIRCSVTGDATPGHAHG